MSFLAFRRLLVDSLDEEDREAHRIVFTYDLLRDKAEQFLYMERSSNNARDLVEDALATPLLREIGENTFAFTHLTLQEYLAARTFLTQYDDDQTEGLRIFCRAYHTPAIVELEVLPMILGVMPNADKYYSEIEAWSDSLTFANIRLRARGLAYGAKLSSQRLALITELLFGMIVSENIEDSASQEAIIRSFRGARQVISSAFVSKVVDYFGPHNSGYRTASQPLRLLGVLDQEEVTVELVEDQGSAPITIPLAKRSAELLRNLKGKNTQARADAAWILGKINTEEAIDSLMEVLQDNNVEVRRGATHSLGQLRCEASVDPVTKNLNDPDVHVRWEAALSLGRIGSALAIDALVLAFRNEEEGHVRETIVWALGAIRSKAAVSGLLVALKDTKASVRSEACEALGKIDATEAAESLVGMLRDREWVVRRSAITALGQIGSESTLKHLLNALLDRYHMVRQEAAETLGTLGSIKAVLPLMASLKDHDGLTRALALKSLAQLHSSGIADQLEQGFRSEDSYVRRKVMDVIAYYGEDQKILDTLTTLVGNDSDTRVCEAAKAAAEKLARKLELLGCVITEGTVLGLTDNDTKDQVLIGDVYRIVGQARHIVRQRIEREKGIDAEIEFNDDNGEATGKMVYLQLKSGDSYLRERKRDSKEIFRITKPRHARYWASQLYPVLLVIRDSRGEIRWMNVTEYLQRHGTNVRQIEFQGEPFTAESVRQMRDRFAGMSEQRLAEINNQLSLDKPNQKRKPKLDH